MSSAVSSVVDTVSDVVGGAADFVGDVGETIVDEVENLDFQDAAEAFIQTGGNPYAAAWAATSGDEKIGFDYGFDSGGTSGGYYDTTYSEPTFAYDETAEQPFTIGFETPTLAPGEWEMQTEQSSIPKGLIDVFGNIATEYLAGQREAVAQDPTSSALAQASSQAVTQSLSNILADVAAGKYARTPSLSFFEQAAMDTTQEPMGILSRYDTAKANLSNVIRPPGLIGMEGRLGIYEDYFQKRGLI